MHHEYSRGVESTVSSCINPLRATLEIIVVVAADGNPPSLPVAHYLGRCYEEFLLDSWDRRRGHHRLCS